MAIFLGTTVRFEEIATVKNRLLSLIHETFEACPKRLVLFFTSYT